MSLDIDRLQGVRRKIGKITAQCPACLETGHDNKGNHLFIMPDGRFGCIMNQGSSGRPHRQRIFALAGDRAAQSSPASPIQVRRADHERKTRRPSQLLDLGTLGTGNSNTRAMRTSDPSPHRNTETLSQTCGIANCRPKRPKGPRANLRAK